MSGGAKVSDEFEFLNFNLAKKSHSSPVFALEILCEVGDNFSPVLKDYWGDVVKNPVDWFISAQQKALEIGASFVSVYFNSQEPQEQDKHEQLNKYVKILNEIQSFAKIPLMIKLSAHGNWDIELARALFCQLKRSAIITPIQATNYKEILQIASTCKPKHRFVLRTPIDINLTKELNILSIDEGIGADKILIDPDMGCIGYGIDYGYSIIERICLARNDGDEMLNMPIIVFAGEESFKAKETKSTDFTSFWGKLEDRALFWEILTSSSLICAGANIVVAWHPETICALKKEFSEVSK